MDLARKRGKRRWGRTIARGWVTQQVEAPALVKRYGSTRRWAQMSPGNSWLHQPPVWAKLLPDLCCLGERRKATALWKAPTFTASKTSQVKDWEASSRQVQWSSKRGQGGVVLGSIKYNDINLLWRFLQLLWNILTRNWKDGRCCAGCCSKASSRWRVAAGKKAENCLLGCRAGMALVSMGTRKSLESKDNLCQNTVFGKEQWNSRAAGGIGRALTSGGKSTSADTSRKMSLMKTICVRPQQHIGDDQDVELLSKSCPRTDTLERPGHGILYRHV